MIELALFPASLFTAAVLLVFGERWTAIAGLALLAATGLTLCQPFGIVVGEEVSAVEVLASTVIQGEGARVWPSFPLLQIRAYSIDTMAPDSARDAKVRTWLTPGLLSHATIFANSSDIDEVQLRGSPTATS